MPVVFLDRLPLPSLRVYTAISVALFSCSLYYASEMTNGPEWKMFKKTKMNSNMLMSNSTFVQEIHLMIASSANLRKMKDIMYYIVQEPLCLSALINMVYCCLVLLGKVIQKLVFGELRVVEQQHLKNKFWNFVFYKFIFIFGVMNVQYMEEVVSWCSWFSILGFLHLLIRLCKDRYEYLSFSPTTPTSTHARLFGLLFGILALSSALLTICVLIGFQVGLNTFCFMAAESVLVVLRTIYVIMRYSIHIWDIRQYGVWEKRITYTYYCDLAFDLTGLTVDFLHHLHMLLWGNILLSMASLVICMQLRYLFSEIQRRIRRHKNYLQVAKYMQMNYPEATVDELESNSDDCAICWDRMDAARKLPCGHLFHASCLRSWLEQVSTCPTCRLPLVTRDNSPLQNNDMNGNNLIGPGQNTLPQNQTTNHFFHFDGSRYVSWFPSFSVEVSHTSILGLRPSPPIQTSQLDNMAHQVHQMFPHMPIGYILDDLRITRSVELTVENILDERLVAPPTVSFPNTVTQRGPSSLQLNPQVSTNPAVAGPSQSSSASDQPSDAGPTKETESQKQPVDNPMETSPVRSGADGCRFSKSSHEREQMLSQRKGELLKKAKQKYMSKILKPSNEQSLPGTSKQ